MSKELNKMRKLRKLQVETRSRLKSLEEFASMFRSKLHEKWGNIDPVEHAVATEAAHLLSKTRVGINMCQSRLKSIKHSLRAYNHIYDTNKSAKC